MAFSLVKGIQSMLGGGKKTGGTPQGGDSLAKGALSDSLVDPLDDKVDQALKALSLDDALAEFRGPLRAVVEERMVPEQLNYLEAVEGGSFDKKTVYEAFIDPDLSDVPVNISNWKDFQALALKGDYDAMDFGSVTSTVRTDLVDSLRALAENKAARAQMREKLEAKSKDTGSKKSAPKPKPLTGLSLAVNKAFNTKAYQAHAAYEATQQKQLAAAEERIAEQKAKADLKVQKALEGMKTEDWLRPPFRDILYRAAQVEFSTENIDFIEAATHKTMSNKAIYDTFIPEKAPRQVNIGAPRKALDALAGQGAYGQMDFTEAVADLAGNTMPDLTQRVASGGSAAADATVDAMRAMRCKMGFPE